jgi:CRP/FNR family transcriptional regulator
MIQFGSPGAETAAVAVARSFLGDLPDPVRLRVLAGAIVHWFRSGTILDPVSAGSFAGLLVVGRAREFTWQPDGRQLTVHYLRPGNAIGLTTIVGVPSRLGVETMSDCGILVLDAERLADASRRDSRLAWAVARELGRSVDVTVDGLAGALSSSVRTRVVRHLQQIQEGPAGTPVRPVKISQRGLAEAVGSVREVVARVLHDLHAEGRLAILADGLLLADEAAPPATVEAR